MPRCRWMAAQAGVALCAGLLSGCLFRTAGKSDVPVEQAPPMQYDVSPDDQPPVIEESIPPPPAAPPTTGQITLLPAPLTDPVLPILPTAAAQKPTDGPVIVMPPPSLPDPPAVAALRAYLDPKPDSEAARLLSRLSKTDREILDVLLPIVDRAVTAGLDHGPKDVDLILKQLELLTETMRPRASLMLSKVSFTRVINGFGDYKALELPQPDNIPSFRAGSDDQPGGYIQVYAEVRNAVSRKAGAIYETALASQVEILNSEGKVDFRMDRPAIPDWSLSPRQDYYLTIDFYVPPHMPPGLYTLQIMVRDVADGTPGGRRAEQRFRFRIEPR